MIVEIIEKIFAEALAELATASGEEEKITHAKHTRVELQIPDKKFGDYSTNVAMASAKAWKWAPIKIANQLSAHVKKKAPQFFDEINVVPPGFINLKLSATAWSKSLVNLMKWIKQPTKSNEVSDKKILLEYVSANPTGPLHIGHGRWAVIGDTLHNVLKYLGYQVQREFYVNDSGEQIKTLHKSLAALKNPSKTDEQAHYQGDYLEKLTTSSIDPVEYFLQEHKQTLQSINVIFDSFFRESTLHAQGSVEEVIELFSKNHHCYKQEGAVWLKTSAAFDDKDRVLKKADGNYTYFAIDCAYHLDKIRRRCHTLINIFGADHHGYVNRLKSALSFLAQSEGIEAPNMEVLIGQLVNIYRDGVAVKMSKRKNTFITLDEVVSEIGKDAVRYYLAMRSANTPLDFDLEQAKKNDLNNPLYYIQYAHARIHAVLQKAKASNLDADNLEKFNYNLIHDDKTAHVVSILNAFSATLNTIAKSYDIYQLPTYLYELASSFHKLYNQSIFIDTNNKAKSKSYLTLVVIVRTVLQRGLSLLNVSAPNTM